MNSPSLGYHGIMPPSDAMSQTHQGPEYEALGKEAPLRKRIGTHRAWTPQEDAYLRATFRKVGTQDIANRLLRTRFAVYQRAMKHLLLPRIRERPRGRKWDPREDAFLKENYGTLPTRELAAALGRTAASIHSKALILDLTKTIVRGPKRPWTTDDERDALANYGRIPISQISRRLNRSPTAVRARASHPRWGEKVTRRRGRIWLLSEDQVLRSDYGRVPTRSIARVLDRTASSINSRAWVLGLTRHFLKSPRENWTAIEDEFLRTAYGKVRPLEVATSIGRSRGSVYHRAGVLGLSAGLGSPEHLRRQSLPRTAQPFTALTNPLDVGYVAGIVDGEGSIVGPPKVTLRVNMTTREVIDHLHKLCGGSVTGPYENRSGRAEICQPQYHWTVSSAESVYRLLRVLLPHLIVKREKAEMVIRFLEKKWFP